MAAYNITLSDGVGIINIPDGSTTTTAADIPLVGQNAQLYGSPVATALLHALENFANDTAPSVNTLDGQLWYDNGTASLTASLNVYDVGTTGNNGAGWNRVAFNDIGTIDNTTSRWDEGESTWVEVEGIRITNANELIVAFDGTGSNVVTVDHDGTDLNIVGTAGTVDVNITGVTAVNMPSLTLVTELDETYGGTGLVTYTTGDILYASGANTLAKLAVGSNTEVLTLAGGVPTWASGGAAGTVTSSGSPLVNEVAVFTAATDIDSDSTFTWDGTTMFATNVTGTNIGGIAQGNLLDKAQNSEVITGTNWDFSGISNSSGQIAATTGTTLRILSNDNTDYVDFSHGSGADDGNFDIVGNATVDLNISGFTGNVVSAVPVHATSGGAESFRAIGDSATWTGADSYISFYDSDESEHGLQIGTLVADGTGARVNARLGDLTLYGSNTLAMTLTPTESTIHITGGIEAMVFRNPFAAGANATTSATVGDIYSNTQHNVGYNETPDGNADVGSNLTVGSFTLSTSSIGKLLNRNVGTSRSITLDSTGLSGDIPIGGSVLILNSQSGGTMTIIPGGGDTLTWIDGSGSTPASATRTLANNSICTVRKNTSTNWQIWGNGLS